MRVGLNPYGTRTNGMSTAPAPVNNAPQSFFGDNGKRSIILPFGQQTTFYQNTPVGEQTRIDDIRRLGDKGQLQDATQQEKNIYEQMQIQYEKDAKVKSMLQGITQQKQMAPGFRPSFFAPMQTNTLLTLLGSTNG